MKSSKDVTHTFLARAVHRQIFAAFVKMWERAVGLAADLPVGLIGPDIAKRGNKLQDAKLKSSAGHYCHVASALVACIKSQVYSLP